jgi:molybdopterin-guanine dinucleotide biosynthesis protein A
MTNVTIAINAGGKSTRMGSDKAFLEVGGRPMIERIIEQTKGLGEQIIITNTPERYAHLGLPMFKDVLPDQGALGGLYTAIHAAAQPYALVLACDMPFVNRPLFEYMISLAPDFDAVVPRITPPLPTRPSTSLRSAQGASGQGPGVRLEAEPFRAIYGKACLAPIRRALEAGKMRVISFFPDMNLRWLDEGEIRRFDPELLTFLNCNTPEELERIREIWEMKEKRESKRQPTNDKRETTGTAREKHANDNHV